MEIKRWAQLILFFVTRVAVESAKVISDTFMFCLFKEEVWLLKNIEEKCVGVLRRQEAD
jgi:hypothetical protein